jgi:S1-C subfamily serine protease
LVDRGEALLQGDIDGYADLEDELTVQPDDTWDIVVAKAISLRQLGRTEDAVAAFGQYGQLFTAADPTAAPYAATAQAFTRQMDEVGVVDGAVYIFTLHANSPARAAGVQVGDIIVALDAQPVRSVSDYQDAIEGAASGVPVTLDVVRMQQGGTFQQLPITIDVPANTEAWPGLLGLGVMPI